MNWKLKLSILTNARATARRLPSMGKHPDIAVVALAEERDLLHIGPLLPMRKRS